MHWTVGGNPPNSACAYNASSSPSQAGPGGDGLVHIAVQTDVTGGFLAASFAGRRGAMVPADAVIGWADAQGAASIGPYSVRVRHHLMWVHMLS